MFQRREDGSEDFYRGWSDYESGFGNKSGEHWLGISLIFFQGGGCSKLMTSLVNVSLKFQRLISQICQYFLLKKCEKLLQSFSSFFKQISVFVIIKS